MDVHGNLTPDGRAIPAVLADFKWVISDSREADLIGVRLIFKLYSIAQGEFTLHREDLFDLSFVNDPQSRGLEFDARPSQREPYPLPPANHLR
jgi:hypothetical protein